MVRLCKSTEKHNDILTCSECYKLYCQLLPINLPSPIGITVAHCIDNTYCDEQAWREGGQPGMFTGGGEGMQLTTPKKRGQPQIFVVCEGTFFGGGVGKDNRKIFWVYDGKDLARWKIFGPNKKCLSMSENFSADGEGGHPKIFDWWTKKFWRISTKIFRSMGGVIRKNLKM
jgi:hypothetical protein